MRGSLFRPDDVSQSIGLGYEVITGDAMFELGMVGTAARVARRVGSPAGLFHLRSRFRRPFLRSGRSDPGGRRDRPPGRR